MAEQHPYLRAWRTQSTPYQRRCIVQHFREALAADKYVSADTAKKAQKVLGYKGHHLPPNTLNPAQWRRVIGIFDTEIACQCSPAAETSARRLLSLVAGFEEAVPLDEDQLSAAQLQKRIEVTARAFVRAMDDHHSLRWRGQIRIEARDPKNEAHRPAQALVDMLDAIDAAEGLHEEDDE